MRQITNGFKYWGQLGLLPVYWLSFLFPRDKTIWLFGSTFGRRFADNPRYFYLYLSQLGNRKKESDRKSHIDGKPIRPIWISQDQELVEHLKQNGYEAYYYYSTKGFWYCLRGKVYFFDNYAKDISFWLSGGAKKINMWHGIPLKKIQHDNTFDPFRHPKNLKERICNFPRNISDEKPHHFVLTTSHFLKPVFSSAFQTEQVLVCGYPRSDRLVGAGPDNLYTLPEQQTIEKMNIRQQANQKMVYYTPTFRDSEEHFFESMDLQRFQDFLKTEGILFCVKLHPKSKLKKEFQKMEGEQIINIDADTDPYVFLEKADILVTDYSSIYFDYLLLDRPIIFFNYDLELYLGSSRELYFDYEEYTPGRKAANQSELQDALKNALNGYDLEEKEKRKLLKEKVFDKDCQVAGPHLLDVMKRVL